MTSLRRAIKRLGVKKGDVILIKDRGTYDQLQDMAIPQLEGTLVIYVHDWSVVRTLSESAMNYLGWYRKESSDAKD